MSHKTKRIVMGKSAAERWIRKHATPEYRVDVYPGSTDVRKLYGLLRSFRDDQYKIGSLDPVRDLGIVDHGDRLTIWSCEHVKMVKLCNYLEGRGYDTSGIW